MGTAISILVLLAGPPRWPSADWTADETPGWVDERLHVGGGAMLGFCGLDHPEVGRTAACGELFASLSKRLSGLFLSHAELGFGFSTNDRRRAVADPANTRVASGPMRIALRLLAEYQPNNHFFVRAGPDLHLWVNWQDPALVGLHGAIDFGTRTTGLFEVALRGSVGFDHVARRSAAPGWSFEGRFGFEIGLYCKVPIR